MGGGGGVFITFCLEVSQAVLKERQPMQKEHLGPDAPVKVIRELLGFLKRRWSV